MLDLAAQRIIVTGGAGFLGRNVVAALVRRGVAPEEIMVPRRQQFDLTTAEGCARLLSDARGAASPTLIIHCAGFVGGLGANRKHPGRFFYDNLAMAMNLIEAARQTGFIDRQG